ncbi:MAG TPA: hypothetical protein VNV37_02730 [Solirubrobacteraceae bacterium]|nr:hypothetical protein [Solirubrobacteraceae bacterium]
MARSDDRGARPPLRGAGVGGGARGYHRAVAGAPAARRAGRVV